MERPFASAAFLVGLLVLLAALPAAAGERVRVGVYENSPKVATSPSGKPEGIFVDLIEAIADAEDWDIEFVPGTWSEGLARLAAGQIDLMPDVARTPEREKNYAFPREPVLTNWNQVYVRRGSGIRSLLDLDGRRVAVLEETIQQEQLVRMASGFGLNVGIVPLPDYATAFRAVAEGKFDAVTTNRFYGLRHAAAAGLEDTAILFDPSQQYFAASKSGNPALLAAIDQHLTAYKKDPASIYYRSLSHWVSEEVRPAVPQWLTFAVLAGLALLVAAAVWLILLRRLVASRTSAIQRRNEQIAIVNQSLRESERKYRELVENANSIILRWAHDGRIIFLNEFGQRFFGYTEDEIRGRHVVGTIVPEAESGGRDLKPLMDDICRNPAAFEQNVNENMRRNGERVWIAWTNKIALDPQGQVAEILSIGTDITARKRMEEELRATQASLEQRVAERTRELAETTAFLDAIVDHIPNPLFYKDSELRFVGCNRANEEAFGLKREDIIGKTVLEVSYLPEAERRIFHEEQTRLLREGGTLRREVAMPFADGSIHQMLHSSRAFRRADGTPGGLVGVLVDVTPLKETEAALLAAKHAAEAADRIKSAFLATMSHELRTPLNSIIGFTGIVLQELAGPLNAEQHKQLGMVRDSARHLLALINDVLDISKIEAGELSVAAEPFDLAASIAKAVSIVRPLAEKKGLALSVKIADGVGAMVGDARRVEQILLNLLGNAIKFTESGAITLDAAPLAAFRPEAGAAPVPAVRLSVADTGMGIKPDDMALLFMPFRQVDSALSRSHEGTGLGLAICRRLAGLMGGIIEAESRWQEGSVFSATLPLQPPAVREPS